MVVCAEAIYLWFMRSINVPVVDEKKRDLLHCFAVVYVHPIALEDSTCVSMSNIIMLWKTLVA